MSSADGPPDVSICLTLQRCLSWVTRCHQWTCHATTGPTKIGLPGPFMSSADGPPDQLWHHG